MLCISDSLACDGIRHCPDGTEYDSDEDPVMCMKHKKSSVSSTVSEVCYKLLSQTIIELNKYFQNSAIDHRYKMTKKMFPMDYATSTVPAVNPVASTVPVDPLVVTKVVDHSVAIEKAKAKERQSLTRGLSRYGPWGYLMLGMLLCGGALLICGLWGKLHILNKSFNRVSNFGSPAECCCRTKKPISTTVDGIPVNVSSISSDQSSNTTVHVSTVEPPNYDEIDPPPSYSALFPNQKQPSDAEADVNVTDVSTESNPAALAPTPATFTSTTSDH